MAGFTLIALLLQQADFEPLCRQALQQREQALVANAAKTQESAGFGAISGRPGRIREGSSYREQALRLPTR
jgi:hypothetical protein